MRYLRTTDSTNHQPSSLAVRIARALLFFIPVANPDYEAKVHLVRAWLVEFDDEGWPDREIGLDATGSPVVAGPNKRNYGFWLDTNMKFGEFTGSAIEEEQFETLWNQFHAKSSSSRVVPVA